MNIRKNFEAIFLAAAAMGLVASYAMASERPVVVAASHAPEIDMSKVHVVIVKAPRLPR